MSMYEVIGTNNPEYLLADPQGADIIAIPCEPGNGMVKRGTVMYRKESGMYAPAATSNVTASNMLVVLDESVDTDENMAVAEDARAYRAGRLVYGKVTLRRGAFRRQYRRAARAGDRIRPDGHRSHVQQRQGDHHLQGERRYWR